VIPRPEGTAPSPEATDLLPPIEPLPAAPPRPASPSPALIAVDGEGPERAPTETRSIRAWSIRAWSIQAWATWVGAAIALITAWRIVALHQTGVPLFFDEAQYWDWSRRLAFGYFSKPPLLAWLIGATTGFLGQTEAAIRLVAPLSHAVAAIFIGLAGYRLRGATLSGARLGGLAALTYLTVPGVAVSSGISSTDAPVLACWAIALYAFIRALDSNAWRWWLVTGVAIGFGLMAKYIMALFAIAGALFLLAAPDRRKAVSLSRACGALALALSIVAPNIAWNAANAFATFGHTAANANLGGALFNPGKMVEFVGAQFGVFGPIPFAILIGLLATFGRWWRDERARLLMILAALPLLIIIAQSFVSRAHANWAAPAYVAASLLVAAWADRTARWIIPLTLALHLAIQVPIAHFDRLLAVAGYDPPVKHDPFRRNRGWDDIGRKIAKRLDERPGAVLLADDRMPLVEMLYYAQAAQVVKWNPGGARRDHYDLSTSMRDLVGRDVLLMTKTPGAVHVRPYFASVTPLGTVWSVTHPDAAIEYEIYWLAGYRGDGAAGAPPPDVSSTAGRP
jgi:hypothetical protein